MDISPEVKLFLRVADNIIEDRKEDLSSLLRPKAFDWERFRAWAVFHELLPFFYSELKDFSLWIPQPFLEILKQNHYGTLIRSQRLWYGFLALVEAFRQQGLSVVPLKGIAGLAEIYRDRPFRAMADIDILIRKQELAQVRKVLAELGYEVSLGGLHESYWLEKHCELTFVKKGTVPVDVHFGLDCKRSRARILSNLWGRTHRRTIDGKDVFLLSPEDQLFSLALHQRRYGGKMLCLKNVFDLAMILKKTGSAFDWDYVVYEAECGRMRATVFFLLLRARLFFEAAIPEIVVSSLKIPVHQRKAIEQFVTANTFALSAQERSKELYLKSHFLLFDDNWEPIRYILSIPREQFAKFYRLEPYTIRTGWLYHGRFLYMAWRYIREKIRFFKKRFCG